MHQKDKENNDLIEEIAYEMFDAPKTDLLLNPIKRELLTLKDVMGKNESWSDRVIRMLRPLQDSCKACSMCELGRKYCADKHFSFDPHVFSNMKPSKWMILNQNPGTNECLKGEPFAGQPGDRLGIEIEQNGLTKSDFYISNIVKCHTNKMSFEHIEKCRPFLEIEFKLLQPKLVIALGPSVFNILCPDHDFSDNLGKIIKSEKYDVKVYPIYYPSTINMSNKIKLKKFRKDIKTLCSLSKKLK